MQPKISPRPLLVPGIPPGDVFLAQDGAPPEAISGLYLGSNLTSCGVSYLALSASPYIIPDTVFTQPSAHHWDVSSGSSLLSRHRLQFHSRLLEPLALTICLLLLLQCSLSLGRHSLSMSYV